MSTSHIKYEQPSSGTGIATETFTEDSITKHFERVVTGHKPNDMTTTADGLVVWESENDLAPSRSLVDGTSDNWTKSSNPNSADPEEYYYNQGDIDFDNVLVLAVEFAFNGVDEGDEGAVGSLGKREWAVGDEDSLGYNTLYATTHTLDYDPDDNGDGYIKVVYALPCAGASSLIISPMFSDAGQSVTIYPLLFQVDSGSVPIVKDEVTLDEVGLSWPNSNVLDGWYPGESVTVDLKGAAYYAVGIKTEPSSGTVRFNTWTA